MKTVDENLTRITNVFTCADGGVEFCKFRFAMEDIEQRDDEASRKLLEIFDTFRKLVDVVTKSKD